MSEGVRRPPTIPLAYGGEDLSPFSNGAHTGEISGPMLADLGCTYVLVGYSERRQQHAETDSTVRASGSTASLWHGVPWICD